MNRSMDYEAILNRARQRIGKRMEGILGKSDPFHNGIYQGLMEAAQILSSEETAERLKGGKQ